MQQIEIDFEDIKDTLIQRYVERKLFQYWGSAQGPLFHRIYGNVSSTFFNKEDKLEEFDCVIVDYVKGKIVVEGKAYKLNLSLTLSHIWQQD